MSGTYGAAQPVSYGNPYQLPPPPNLNTNPGNAQPGQLTGSASAPSWSPQSAPAPTGLQPGDPNAGNIGVDWSRPGMGENVSSAYLGYYGQNGTPTTSNRAEEAYQSFRGSTPQNMDPYYNNAERNTVNDINKQMAARGSYGSSNAIGNISNATTNLRSQQAKDEAQYGLQRAGLMGQLGTGADQSSVQQSNNEMNWMGGLSNLGFANQKENAARGQQVLDNQYRAASTMSGIQGQVGSAEIQNDQDLLQMMLAAGSGATADQVAAAQTKLAQDRAQSNQNNAALTGAATTLAGTAKDYV